MILKQLKQIAIKINQIKKENEMIKKIEEIQNENNENLERELEQMKEQLIC